MKVIRNLLVVALFVGAFYGVSYYEHHYTRHNCEVIEATNYGAIFEDECGFTWMVEGEGYEVGQIADIKMYDNLTHCIDDDEIKEVIIK